MSTHTHTFRLCQSTWYHPGFDLLSKFPKQLQLFWNYHWKNMPTCEKFTHVDPSFHKQLVQSKTNPSCEDNEGFLLQLSRHPIFHCVPSEWEGGSIFGCREFFSHEPSSRLTPNPAPSWTETQRIEDPNHPVFRGELLV